MNQTRVSNLSRDFRACDFVIVKFVSSYCAWLILTTISSAYNDFNTADSLCHHRANLDLIHSVEMSKTVHINSPDQFDSLIKSSAIVVADCTSSFAFPYLRRASAASRQKEQDRIGNKVS